MQISVLILVFFYFLFLLSMRREFITRTEVCLKNSKRRTTARSLEAAVIRFGKPQGFLYNIFLCLSSHLLYSLFCFFSPWRGNLTALEFQLPIKNPNLKIYFGGERVKLLVEDK